MLKCRCFFLLLSCLLPAPLRLPCRLARAEDSAPRFGITPHRALCDEPVKAYLLNLKPNQHVTVRASAGILKSELEFTADAQGRVDLGGPEPEVARQKKGSLDLCPSPAGIGGLLRLASLVFLACFQRSAAGRRAR
jgi:hypothetical protein